MVKHTYSVYGFYMKRIASLLLLLSLALPVHAEQTLSFGYIGAPLSYSSLAVLKVAYEKIGIRINGHKLPAARSLAQSDAGLTDGEVHRIKAIELEHPELIRIDAPINSVEGLALSCDKSIDITASNTLKNYRIGVKIGTRYAEKLTAEMPFVTRAVDENKLMELLLVDKLDIVIGDRPWAEAQIMLPEYKCVRINEPPLKVIPLYHYLHVRHSSLVPKITRVLREMEQSGESKRIVRKALASIKGRSVPE